MSEPTMREFGLQRVSELLDQLVFELHRAAGRQDASSVHHARVAIRRFDQALRVFQQYLPHGAAKKIRKTLKDVMDAAGEVRNRDIALRLIADAPGAKVLEAQRKEAKHTLSQQLRTLGRPGLSGKWRTSLKLGHS